MKIAVFRKGRPRHWNLISHRSRCRPCPPNDAVHGDSTDGSQELLEYIEEAVQENPVLEPEETYDKQDKAITDMVREMGGMQTRYMSTANRILSENQEIQKMQQQDYQHIVDYLKDAEKSAAKFWVACNQAMQKYVETAASSIERVGATGQASADLIQANSKMAEQFTARWRILPSIRDFPIKQWNRSASSSVR